MKIKQNKIYNIGENIQKIRKQNNMTQTQVITHLQILGFNISRETFSQIERGVSNIRVEFLIALADLFNVEIQAFFEGLKLKPDEEEIK